MKRQDDVKMKVGSPDWCRSVVEHYRDCRLKHVESWWKEVRDAYEGRHLGRNGRPQDDPTTIVGQNLEPNRVFSIAHAVAATVVNRYPTFFVSAQNADMEDFAEFAQEAAQNDWKMNYALLRDIRTCAIDAETIGMGVTCTLFESDYEEEAKKRAKRVKEAGRISKAVELGLIDPSTLGIPSDSFHWEDPEPSAMGDDRSFLGRICTFRVDPFRFLIDPTAGSISNARWVGDFFYAHADLVRASPIFTGVSDLPASQMDDRDLPFSGFDVGPYELIKITRIYYRAVDGKWNVRYMAEGRDDFIYKYDGLPFHPYDVLRWNDLGDTIWTTSDIRAVWPLILQEANVCTKSFDQMMRQQEDVSIVDGSALGEGELLAVVDDPNIGKYVKVTNPDRRNLDTLFSHVMKDPITPELLPYLSLLRQQIQEGVGLGNNQLSGGALKSETSAAEATTIDRWVNARSVNKAMSMDEFASCIAHKRLKLMVMYFPADVVAMMQGPEQAAKARLWKFTDGDVRYGLSITVEPGSMQPPSEAKLQQLYMALIQMANQSAVAAGLLNTPEAFRELFHSMGVPRRSKLLNPNVDSNTFSKALAAQQLAQGGPRQAPGGGGGGAPPPAAAAAMGASNNPEQLVA